MAKYNTVVTPLLMHWSYHSLTLSHWHVVRPPYNNGLTHWGRVTHVRVSKLAIIGSDNGLSPGRHQANIWTNTGILLIGPLGTNFNEILNEIYSFSFKKMHLKMSSGKWWPFCLSLNVLIQDHIADAMGGGGGGGLPQSCTKPLTCHGASVH